jgi:hypothetical protein
VYLQWQRAEIEGTESAKFLRDCPPFETIVSDNRENDIDEPLGASRLSPARLSIAF